MAGIVVDAAGAIPVHELHILALADAGVVHPLHAQLELAASLARVPRPLLQPQLHIIDILTRL